MSLFTRKAVSLEDHKVVKVTAKTYNLGHIIAAALAPTGGVLLPENEEESHYIERG